MSAFKDRDQYNLRMQLIDNHGKVIDSVDYPPGDWMKMQEYFNRYKKKIEGRQR